MMFESTCLTLFLYLTDINKIEESKYYCFTTSSRCVAPVTILYKITTLHVLLPGIASLRVTGRPVDAKRQCAWPATPFETRARGSDRLPGHPLGS